MIRKQTFTTVYEINRRKRLILGKDSQVQGISVLLHDLQTQKITHNLFENLFYINVLHYTNQKQ